MKNHQDSNDAVVRQIGLAVQAMEEFFSQATEEYYNTPVVLGKPWYALGLESNYEDGQRDQASKRHIIDRIVDAFIKFVGKILDAISEFFSRINFTEEQKRAARAREIRKNRQEVKFAEAIVEKLPKHVLVTLYAAEVHVNFTEVFNKNLQIDRKIVIPRNWDNPSDVEKVLEVSKELEEGIDTLQRFLNDAESVSEDRRAMRIGDSLKNGVSINGSENGDYLKSFASANDARLRYSELLGAAERFKRNGADPAKVAAMQKVATTLSNQFAMETKVFTAYTKLNRSIIEVNDVIFAKE